MIAEKVVIDTNTALDFLVFEDPGVQALYEAVTRGATQWLVCPPMRVELARVLDYPLVAKRREAPSSFSRATTATGSVADAIEPKSSEADQLI